MCPLKMKEVTNMQNPCDPKRKTLVEGMFGWGLKFEKAAMGPKKTAACESYLMRPAWSVFQRISSNFDGIYKREKTDGKIFFVVDKRFRTQIALVLDYDLYVKKTERKISSLFFLHSQTFIFILTSGKGRGVMGITWLPSSAQGIRSTLICAYRIKLLS